MGVKLGKRLKQKFETVEADGAGLVLKERACPIKEAGPRHSSAYLDYCPNLFTYSSDEMKALTISAWT